MKKSVKETSNNFEIKKIFRLYSDGDFNFQSSMFDMMSMDKETTQTKGLAYILSLDEDLLYGFIDKIIFPRLSGFLNPDTISKFRDTIGVNCSNITSIVIEAEKPLKESGNSQKKSRPDIIITLWSKERIPIVFLIEAKNINASVNENLIDSQLTRYYESYIGKKEGCTEPNCIMLTKYRSFMKKIVSVTWGDVIELLISHINNKRPNQLVNQYLNYLIGVDKSMKYYEKEVLSIPAGKTYDWVHKYKIYVCPNTKSYNYKKSLYLTFRKAVGGEMEYLYKVDDIICINTNYEEELEHFKESNYPEERKQRVLDFFENEKKTSNIKEDRQIFILSKEEKIELKNKPKPNKNNIGIIYYTLSEILKEEKPKPESQLLKGKNI